MTLFLAVLVCGLVLNIKGETFAEILTTKHNEIRQKISHGGQECYGGENCPKPKVPLPDLVWDKGLEFLAKSYAEECKFAHQGRGEMLRNWEKYTGTSHLREKKGTLIIGENIAKNIMGADAVEYWASESALYDWNNPPHAESDPATGKLRTLSPHGTTGHWTQLADATTTHLGCYEQICETEDYTLTLCKYYQGQISKGEGRFVIPYDDALDYMDRILSPKRIKKIKKKSRHKTPHAHKPGSELEPRYGVSEPKIPRYGVSEPKKSADGKVRRKHKKLVGVDRRKPPGKPLPPPILIATKPLKKPLKTREGLIPPPIHTKPKYIPPKKREGPIPPPIHTKPKYIPKSKFKTKKF